MTRTRPIYTLAMLVFSILVLVGCTNPGVTPAALTVAVTPTTASIVAGTTVQLTATVDAASGVDKSVTWSSSDNTKATVSNTGLVTGVAVGTATITATSTVDTSKKASATITITAPTITAVAVTPATKTLAIGEEFSFSANVTGTGSFSNAVTWASNDTSKADVDASGKVTAKAAGSVTITATSVADTSKSASATLTISTATISNVTIDPTAKLLSINGTQQFTATVTGSTGFDPSVSWSSSDAAVASVDASGLVTAHAAGTTTITATSVADTSKSASATVTVASALTFQNYANLAATLNTAIPAQNPSVAGGSTPYAFEVVGTPLPAGLSLDASTGVISGTPSSVSAAANYTIKVTDNLGATASATINITVNATPSVSGYSNATLTVGAAYTSATPVASGGTGTKSFSISPALPAGLSVSSSTGVISGTPSVASGSTTYTVTVTDANGATGTTTLNLVVNDALSVSTNYSAQVGTVGAALTSSTPAVAGGTAPISFSAASLPAGLSINPGTGVISGTPSAVSAATDYTVVATDANGATVDLSINLTVNAAPTISGYSNATLTVGRAFTSATPVVSGGTGTKTLSISPALPTGLSISSSTGVISGTPSAASANTTYTVTATDANGATGTTTLSILVNAAPTVGTNYTSPVIAAVGRTFTSSTPVVSGGTGPFSFAVSPALPAGLSISSSTGVISGTPTNTTGATAYTVTATDANGATVNFSINIDVNNPPTLSYTVSRNLTLGRAIAEGNNPGDNYNLSTGSGTGARTYAVLSGNLPNGLSLTTSGFNGGLISGTPTTVGSFSAVIRVTDSAGYTTDATFAISVNPAPTITYSSATYTASASATNGTAVAPAPTVTPGTPNYTFSVASQSFVPASGPVGTTTFSGEFNLSSSTGAITTTNTPRAGTYTITIRVTDANGSQATTTTITITVS